jgi:hypothetical protein
MVPLVLSPTTIGDEIGSTFPHPCHGTFGTGETFSFHPGGAHVAFDNGSVRFIRETIGIREYARLVTRANGEVITQ